MSSIDSAAKERNILFLAWSGPASKQLAKELADWFPMVVPSIATFVSDENMRTGVRWFEELNNTLGRATLVVPCLTPENVESRWIHFEIGMSMAAGNGQGIWPVLFEITSAELLAPISHFQCAPCTKQGFDKLTKEINQVLPHGENDILRAKRFEAHWKALEPRLREIVEVLAKEPELDTMNAEDMLRELLELMREQRRRLLDPAQILPATYVAQILEDLAGSEQALARLSAFVAQRAGPGGGPSFVGLDR